MSNSFDKGSRVHWAWGQGTGHGTVEERFERRVQRTIKGARIVRNGTAENPAYLIRGEEGPVLKRGSELKAG